MHESAHIILHMILAFAQLTERHEPKQQQPAHPASQLRNQLQACALRAVQLGRRREGQSAGRRFLEHRDMVIKFLVMVAKAGGLHSGLPEAIVPRSRTRHGRAGFHA